MHDWMLRYSTEQHGCSLRTAYNRCEGVGSTVLLVLDGQGSIFGAFSGDAWRVDKHYYGNGESFLFTVHPQFQVYPWTIHPHPHPHPRPHPHPHSYPIALTLTLTLALTQQVYPWTRANDHFVLAAHDCLAFGSEDAGIYLDSASTNPKTLTLRP